MRRSLPQAQSSVRVDEFGASGRIDYDAAGHPMIHARSRPEAVRLLGYAVARDRMFQMDMLRRGPAGRLAELLGERAVASDRRASLRMERGLVTTAPAFGRSSKISPDGPSTLTCRHQTHRERLGRDCCAWHNAA